MSHLLGSLRFLFTDNQSPQTFSSLFCSSSCTTPSGMQRPDGPQAELLWTTTSILWRIYSISQPVRPSTLHTISSTLRNLNSTGILKLWTINQILEQELTYLEYSQDIAKFKPSIKRKSRQLSFRLIRILPENESLKCWICLLLSQSYAIRISTKYYLSFEK